MIRDFEIIISTVQRPKLYLNETVKRLRTLPLVFMVGNLSPTIYLDSLYDNKKIISMPITEWDKVKTKHEKFNLNFTRCLELSEKNLLYLEDDIVFRPNWFSEFKRLIRIPKSKFVLSLHHPELYASPVPKKLNYTVSNVPLKECNDFWGTQAVYFPKEIRKDFAKFMREKIYTKLYGDVHLSDYCKEFNISILLPQIPLVHHVGEESSLFLA